MALQVTEEMALGEMAHHNSTLEPCGLHRRQHHDSISAA